MANSFLRIKDNDELVRNLEEYKHEQEYTINEERKIALKSFIREIRAELAYRRKHNILRRNGKPITGNDPRKEDRR